MWQGGPCYTVVSKEAVVVLTERAASVVAATGSHFERGRVVVALKRGSLGVEVVDASLEVGELWWFWFLKSLLGIICFWS